MQSSSQVVTTNEPTSNFLQAGCPSGCKWLLGGAALNLTASVTRRLIWCRPKRDYGLWLGRQQQVLGSFGVPITQRKLWLIPHDLGIGDKHYSPSVCGKDSAFAFPLWTDDCTLCAIWCSFDQLVNSCLCKV